MHTKLLQTQVSDLPNSLMEREPASIGDSKFKNLISGREQVQAFNIWQKVSLSLNSWVQV